MSENHIHLIISRKVANGVQNNISTLCCELSYKADVIVEYKMIHLFSLIKISNYQ